MRVKARAITIIRNEGDIVSAWLSHALALFDEVLVMDHGSTDGTRELLDLVASRWENLRVLGGLEPGYYQSEYTNLLARLAATSPGDCWIFPLDADEFLPFETPAAFAAFLDGHQAVDAIRFHWRNCIPCDLGEDRVFDPLEALLVPSSVSPFAKLALRRALIVDGGGQLTQGNHAVEFPNGDRPLAEADGGVILHVPIRSLPQFALKIVQGVAAYRRRIHSRRGDRKSGSHWFAMLDHVRRVGLTPGVLRSFGRDYGLAPAARDYGSSIEALEAAGYRRTALRLAALEELPAVSPRRRFAELIGDLVHRDPEILRAEGAREMVDAAMGDFHVEDSRVVHKLCADATRFEPLPDEPEPEQFEEFDLRGVHAFIAPSLEPVEEPAPSTWMGHAPFLFALMSFLRPRRHVELGVHRGASFFAACQVSKRNDNCTECIAVDTWEGDDHSGRYDTEVFEQFRLTLSEAYPECGRYIQRPFDAAAEQFATGSIDLLHIDGLHYYESVSHDFETWRPKMSERGVILLHDTVVHERGFGVWRLWERLRTEFPSMEFLHSYGLGVIFVGSERGSRAHRLLAACQDPELAGLLRTVFSGVGVRGAELLQRQHVLEEERARLTLETERQAAEIRRWETESGSRTREIEHLTAEARSRESEIERLTAEACSRESEIERLTDAVRSRETEVERRIAEAKVREEEIARLTAESRSQGDEIARLGEQTRVREMEIEQLTAEASVREGEIARLTAESRSQWEEIARLGEEARSREGEIEHLTADARSRVEELQEAVAALTIQLDAVMHTISWRVTRPLRWVRRILGGNSPRGALSL